MRFIETPIFTEDVSQELSPEDYRQLQLALMLRPEDSETPGGRGVQMRRKDFERLVTSLKQAGAIRRGRLKPGRVTEFHPDDVRATRLKLGKSQEEFALMIGVSVATLQNWEQGRRRPDGPARALLRVAARNPRAVAKALAS